MDYDVGAGLRLFLELLRAKMTSPSTLNVLVPMFNAETFWYRALNFISLFLVLWVVVLSLRLSLLYRGCAPITACILVVGYVLLAIGFAESRGGSS